MRGRDKLCDLFLQERHRGDASWDLCLPSPEPPPSKIPLVNRSK